MTSTGSVGGSKTNPTSFSPVKVLKKLFGKKTDKTEKTEAPLKRESTVVVKEEKELKKRVKTNSKKTVETADKADKKDKTENPKVTDKKVASSKGSRVSPRERARLPKNKSKLATGKVKSTEGSRTNSRNARTKKRIDTETNTSKVTTGKVKNAPKTDKNTKKPEPHTGLPRASKAPGPSPLAAFPSEPINPIPSDQLPKVKFLGKHTPSEKAPEISLESKKILDLLSLSPISKVDALRAIGDLGLAAKDGQGLSEQDIKNTLILLKKTFKSIDFYESEERNNEGKNIKYSEMTEFNKSCDQLNTSSFRGILKVVEDPLMRGIMHEAKSLKKTDGPLYSNTLTLYLQARLTLKIPTNSGKDLKFDQAPSSPESKLAAQAILEEVLKA